jgi:hypothetical protein
MYIDLSEFPAGLATMLSINEWAAGVLLSLVLIAIVMIPLSLISRGHFELPLMAGVLLIIFCTVIGWLDSWVMILVILGIAGMYALVSGRVGG